ncbi:hypothetical protein BDW75DRAFT_249536 [Aspergillus navahoensis]
MPLKMWLTETLGIKAPPSPKMSGVNNTMFPAMNAPDYLAYAKVAVSKASKPSRLAGNPEPNLKYLKSNSLPFTCVSIGYALKVDDIAPMNLCGGKRHDPISIDTRWMCTAESPIHQNVKEAIVKMDENGTILVLRKFRNTTLRRMENSELDPRIQEVAHFMSVARGRGSISTCEELARTIEREAAKALSKASSL